MLAHDGGARPARPRSPSYPGAWDETVGVCKRKAAVAKRPPAAPWTTPTAKGLRPFGPMC